MLAVITLIGTVSQFASHLKASAYRGYWYITRFFTASISIAGDNILNGEGTTRMATHVFDRWNPRILTASYQSVNDDSWMYESLGLRRDDRSPTKRKTIRYLPTFGTTWFTFERNIFTIRRVGHSSVRSDMPDEYASGPSGQEPLVVMCLGRSASPIKRFLEACRSFAERQRETFLTVRVCKGRRHLRWDTTVLKPIRPLETIHFDDNIKNALVADVKNYLNPDTLRFYSMRGIPYRRGYLLHGPPGTGKTSLSFALAGLFGLELFRCRSEPVP